MLNDILSHTSKDKLDTFIAEYAESDGVFKTAFLTQFSPKPKSSKTKKKPEEDYVRIIGKAFSKGNRLMKQMSEERKHPRNYPLLLISGSLPPTESVALNL